MCDAIKIPDIYIHEFNLFPKTLYKNIEYEIMYSVRVYYILYEYMIYINI